MIGIIDYGLGNVRAFTNIYNHLGIPAEIIAEPKRLAEAERIVLPGVGAFDYAMQKLNASGLREVLNRRVMQDGIPVLGVCVGMQMMAESSEEGREPGLGWISASVRHFASLANTAQPVPHMGWNTIVARPAPLLEGVDKAEFYFLHSFCVVCNNPANVIARTIYGVEFDSAVRQGNVMGTQFHPEKSHAGGIRLLLNFAKA